MVVVHRGMLFKNNITLTTEKGYEFILGERLKSLPKADFYRKQPPQNT